MTKIFLFHIIIIIIIERYIYNTHTFNIIFNFPAEYINVCHANDPKLNECVKKSILNLRPYLSKGIKELSIPSCDPLEIDKISLEQDSGPINLNSRFENIKIHGLSQFRIRAVRIDAQKAKFRLRLWFPELHMVADYYVKGKFLMVPMVGNGKSTGNFCELDF